MNTLVGQVCTMINKKIKYKCKNCQITQFKFRSRIFKKFCSNICKYNYFEKHQISAWFNPKLQHKNGIVGGHIAGIINRKNHTGMYHDKKIQSKAGKIGGLIGGKIGGKRAAIVNRKNKTGAFYGLTKKQRSENGRRGGKAAAISNRINHTGWFNSEVQKKNSENAYKILCKKYKWIWYNTKFISRDEMLCAKQILNKPKLGYNCQYLIDGKRIDFYPQKEDKMFQGMFVEYHPINKFLCPEQTIKSYYVTRRKVLDENGYKSKKLIVIQNLKELENYT